MTVATRTILTVLIVILTAGLFAQTATTTTTAPAPQLQPQSQANGLQMRKELTSILSESPDDLVTILALEPSLLTNDQFLAAHPELARFVAAHPEVRLQPTYYLADFAYRARHSSTLEKVLEPVAAFVAFLVVTFALAWLLRIIIEQRRWSQLSRTQSEVHNKILDRFGSSAELLEYVKSPAGSKFLESAPIPLRVDGSLPPSPPGRAIGSIQIGVILAAGAAGMLLISGRYTDAGPALFALGVIGLCVGAGFILSAALSIILSRRFGLWQQQLPE